MGILKHVRRIGRGDRGLAIKAILQTGLRCGGAGHGGVETREALDFRCRSA